ncbi:monocarboxylate permease [Scheffersomyces xylosifermentans]|uniref:monocarboxylate permease n=1 Tax=Scheffersomyces xylosifermentans TaxID=1304137 RepID=UPI00315DEF2A
MSFTESIELTRTHRDVDPVVSLSNVVRVNQEERIPLVEEENFPDGGLEAYTVVLGSFLGLIVNLGIINAIGAVQAYVSTHQLAMVKASTASWIFSIYLALAYVLGIIVGSIFDKKGPMGLMIASTVLIFVGLIASANSTEVYQFILSFISLGIGNGIGMTPLIGVISHWFLKKRGNCIGLAMSGGSVGGLVFPLMLRHSYSKFGYAWAMRIFAFTCLCCMVVSTILVKGRALEDSAQSVLTQRPLSEQEEDAESKKRNLVRRLSFLSVFSLSDYKYLYLVAGAFFCEVSLVLLLTYFATYAIAHGISESTSLLLLTAWNGAGIAGRWVPSYFSDAYGRFNMNILMLSIFNISIFVIWLPFGGSAKVLFTFAAVGGFCQGAISSLLPACLSQITPANEIGSKFGLLNTITSTGNLFGIPLASVVINDGSVHNYQNFVILVGCLSSAGLIVWYMSRYSIVGLRFNVRV